MTVKNGVFSEQPGRSRVGNGRGGGSAAARGAGSERETRKEGVRGVPVNYFVGKAPIAFSIRYRPARLLKSALRAATGIKGLERTPGRCGWEWGESPARSRTPASSPAEAGGRCRGAAALPASSLRALRALPAPSFPFFFTC